MKINSEAMAEKTFTFKEAISLSGAYSCADDPDGWLLVDLWFDWVILTEAGWVKNPGDIKSHQKSRWIRRPKMTLTLEFE